MLKIHLEHLNSFMDINFNHAQFYLLAFIHKNYGMAHLKHRYIRYFQTAHGYSGSLKNPYSARHKRVVIYPYAISVLRADSRPSETP